MADLRKFGFDQLAKMLDSASFKRRFKVDMLRAQKRVGSRFQDDVRERINDHKYAANSLVTVLGKGSDTPLVAGGDLFGSVTWNAEPFRIQLGVASIRLKSGRLLAEVLHNGATIPVTPLMRKALFARLSKSARRRLASVDGPKPFWTIPARPYLGDVFKSRSWRSFAQRQYADAIHRTIRFLASRGSK